MYPYAAIAAAAIAATPTKNEVFAPPDFVVVVAAVTFVTVVVTREGIVNIVFEIPRTLANLCLSPKMAPFRGRAPFLGAVNDYDAVVRIDRQGRKHALCELANHMVRAASSTEACRTHL